MTFPGGNFLLRSISRPMSQKFFLHLSKSFSLLHLPTANTTCFTHLFHPPVAHKKYEQEKKHPTNTKNTDNTKNTNCYFFTNTIIQEKNTHKKYKNGQAILCSCICPPTPPVLSFTHLPSTFTHVPLLNFFEFSGGHIHFPRIVLLLCVEGCWNFLLSPLSLPFLLTQRFLPRCPSFLLIPVFPLKSPRRQNCQKKPGRQNCHRHL